MEKKAAIICPESRHGLEFLSKNTLLALVPFCGKSLLDHSLTEIASKGYRHVDLYVSDRPEAIRGQVKDGSKWGISTTINPTSREWTPNEVLEEKDKGSTESSIKATDVFLMDRIPLEHPNSLFSDYENWFKRLIEYMPLAAAAQIGMTKRFPNVWIGTGSQVAPTARLNAPCWIGRNVLIGDNAVIGPNTIIEDQCFVDEKAVIEESHVAQRTYIGTNTDVVKSFAWGPKLLNWQNGSGLVIQDRFLLARLGAGEDRSNQFQPGLGERILAVLTMILTCPILAVFALWLRFNNGQCFEKKKAITPQRIEDDSAPTYFTYTELSVANPRIRRLPRLWSIAAGSMAWFGNPPLPPEAGKLLETEFDRLWLASPCGLASLGDCYQCLDPSNDDARAHATFFAVHADTATKRKILSWLLFGS
ncbi:MAG: hypothetical protein HOI66_22585 [Verrucomicrobia bacterium]|jgi:hypothetical protein|nr:hypothetical protein [Verrucomicrobiota bacterium]